MQNERADSLGLAVTHMNTSVGRVLTKEELIKALRAGSVNAIDSPTSAAAINYLFVELDPQLIVSCAYDAGSDVAHANMIYQEGLLHAMPRVPIWEESIKYML